MSMFSNRVIAYWQPKVIGSPIIAVKIFQPPIIIYTAQTNLFCVEVKLDSLKIISHRLNHQSKSWGVLKSRLPVAIN